MKLIRLLLLLSITLITHQQVNCQVKASFKTSTTKGCGLTIIHFTNTSSPTDSIRWFLVMNGITIKDSTNVSLSFSPGTYHVKLIAYNHVFSPSSDTSVVLINIYNPPVAHFSVDRLNAFLPDTAHFTDLSQKGDGVITNWYWDFRDGTTSNLKNTTHIYPAKGTYSIDLKVTDSNQCISDTTKINYISVDNFPVVGF